MRTRRVELPSRTTAAGGAGVPAGTAMSDERRAGGIGLEVLEAGDGGRPLLLVHGFTGAKEDFADSLDALAALGWHVVAPDHRGHGASDQPDDEDSYSLADRSPPTSWRWPTPSAGTASCCSATRWAAWSPSTWSLDHPDRVAALVLMDTSHGALEGLDPEPSRWASRSSATAGWSCWSSSRRERDGAPGHAGPPAPGRDRPGYAECGDRKLLACSPAHVAGDRRARSSTSADRLDAAGDGARAHAGDRGRAGRAVHGPSRAHGQDDPGRPPGGDPRRRPHARSSRTPDAGGPRSRAFLEEVPVRWQAHDGEPSKDMAASWRWRRCAGYGVKRDLHAVGRAHLPDLRRLREARRRASTTSATSRPPRSPPRAWPSSPAGPASPCSPPDRASPTASARSPPPTSTARRSSCSAAGRRRAAGARGRCRSSTTCRSWRRSPSWPRTVTCHGRHRQAGRARRWRPPLTPHRGPVFVDFPLDVVFASGEADVPDGVGAAGADPDPDDVARAAALLAGAERPAIVAGGDVWWDGAWDALRRCVEELRVPTFVNGLGRGCLPADHELAFARTRGRLKRGRRGRRRRHAARLPAVVRALRRRPGRSTCRQRRAAGPATCTPPLSPGRRPHRDPRRHRRLRAATGPTTSRGSRRLRDEESAKRAAGASRARGRHRPDPPGPHLRRAAPRASTATRS